MTRTGVHGGAASGRPPKRTYPLATLVLVPLALYASSLTFDFVRADDVDLIVANQAFLADFGNLPRAFRQSYFEVEGQPTQLKTYYRPLVIASFMADAHLGGPRPAVYHATNVAIHTAVVALLFFTLPALGASRGAAFVAALLFAVHPLSAPAVCWVAGRNDSLLALFSLASLLALARYMARPRASVLALHLAAFTLALFTKETALGLLAAYVLYAWLWQSRPRYFLVRPGLIAAYAAICAVWGLLRAAALAGSPGVLPNAGAYATTWLANSPQILLDLGKVLFPVRLSVAPEVDAAGLALGAAAAAILGGTLARFGDARTAAFGLAWFAIFLAPGLLVPGLPAYEHRAYVPMLGLAMTLSRTRFPTLTTVPSRRVAIAFAALTIALATLTAIHAAHFRDPFTYWKRVTRSRAWAPIAHVNLGRMYEEQGDLSGAYDEYRAALLINPATPKAHNNLGVVLMAMQRPAEAEHEFKEEVRLHAWNPEAHYNLGLYYKLRGRADDSVPLWEKAIELDPFFTDAYRQLAEYYEAKGDREQAEEYRSKVNRAMEP